MPCPPSLSVSQLQVPAVVWTTPHLLLNANLPGFVERLKARDAHKNKKRKHVCPAEDFVYAVEGGRPALIPVLLLMLLLPPRLRVSLEAIARQEGGCAKRVLALHSMKTTRRYLAQLARHNLVRFCHRAAFRGRGGTLSVWATPKGKARAALAVPPAVQDRAYWLNQSLELAKQHQAFRGIAEQFTAMVESNLSDIAVQNFTIMDETNAAAPLVRAWVTVMMGRCGVQEAGFQHPVGLSAGQD
jgi:hypothetical protein